MIIGRKIILHPKPGSLEAELLYNRNHFKKWKNWRRGELRKQQERELSAFQEKQKKSEQKFRYSKKSPKISLYEFIENQEKDLEQFRLSQNGAWKDLDEEFKEVEMKMKEQEQQQIEDYKKNRPLEKAKEKADKSAKKKKRHQEAQEKKEKERLEKLEREQTKKEKKEAQKHLYNLINIGGNNMSFFGDKNKEKTEKGNGSNLMPDVKRYLKEAFSCAMFWPTQPAGKITIGKSPKIILTREAYDDMRALVGLADKEIGWLGTVHRPEDEPEQFIIEKIILVKQKVSGANCTLDAKAINGFFSEKMGTDEGEELCNSIAFWGHSHHTMAVTPSSQDVSQFDTLSANTDYYIRGIFNKAGQVNFTLRVNPFNITFENVQWEILDPSFDQKIEEIAQEMNEKLEEH